jgi:hypothetical protein
MNDTRWKFYAKFFKTLYYDLTILGLTEILFLFISIKINY